MACAVRFSLIHWLWVGGICLAPIDTTAEVFRVATYNLESYLETATQTRAVKSEESKAAIRESILALKPDVLAVQELGSQAALLELRDSLKTNGLAFEYWQFVSGHDTNIHLGLLSRFPFTAYRAYTNESFLLNGRRLHVSRGFLEADIAVTHDYSFTLISAHLKSKRAAAEADEADLRLEEARLLREKIDARLAVQPDLDLVVLGDFNDTQDSPSTRAVIGRGKSKLVDTRPAERNGTEPTGGAPAEHRLVTWTHYFSKEDTYRRIDFVLVSRTMARKWKPQESFVLARPDWGRASDHRPVLAVFDSSGR